MRLNDNRMSSADWVNLALFLDLNDGQRFLFMVLPHLAEPNGCFEHDPKMICGLTRCAMPDLEILFRLLNTEGLIIPYKMDGKNYWYLTRFLELQRLRQKAKVPSPPWLYWEPEPGSPDMSKGKYKVNPEKLQQYTGIQTLDINPPPERSREERSRDIKEETLDKKLPAEVGGNNAQGIETVVKEEKISASASKEERITQALNQLLDGATGIRATLNGSDEQQRQTIQRMLQVTSRSLKIADIVKEFEVVCDEGNWKVRVK